MLIFVTHRGYFLGMSREDKNTVDNTRALLWINFIAIYMNL
jgi:hypothetical protein